MPLRDSAQVVLICQKIKGVGVFAPPSAGPGLLNRGGGGNNVGSCLAFRATRTARDMATVATLATTGTNATKRERNQGWSNNVMLSTWASGLSSGKHG